MDAAGAVCYLETFALSNIRFYARLGFEVGARFEEPTILAEYAIMVRHPNSQSSRH